MFPHNCFGSSHIKRNKTYHVITYNLNYNQNLLILVVVFKKTIDRPRDYLKFSVWESHPIYNQSVNLMTVSDWLTLDSKFQRENTSV